MLRCIQIGLSLADLEYLTFGMVVDMMTEAGKDDTEENVVEATQADFDNF